MNQINVLVPIANGIEEIEAVCIIDILRRAGANVVVASVNEIQILASRGVKIVADKLISECISEDYDLIVLPGGMAGAENLRDSVELNMILQNQCAKNKYYAAICASPILVLKAKGLLKDKRATTHPKFVDQLENKIKFDNRVVVDNNLITSKGPGTAIEFTLKIVELLYGIKKANELAFQMVV